MFIAAVESLISYRMGNKCECLGQDNERFPLTVFVTVFFVVILICVSFQIEVRELHERLRLEKEAWEENYMKKHETWLMQKERELKENVRRDRDKEIELIIGRLEEDATSSREECERTAENKIKYVTARTIIQYKI